MTSKYCRTVLIETINLSDQSLSQISKSVSETLRVASHRMTKSPTITHIICYLVDIQCTQISRLLSIKSKQFLNECLPKLSNLKPPKKRLIPNPNICENIANLLKDIRESINRSNDLIKTELTYICGRDVEEVIDDFTFAFDGKQIDSSFLSQINIVCIKRSVDQNVMYGPTNANFSGISNELRALLDIQTLDETTIDGYFKVWLHDLTIDYERVRIHLSSQTEEHKNSDKYVIRCDLREALIDTNRLLIAKSGQKLNSSQIEALESVPNICETKRCYDLQLLGLISRSGLCDSVLYGIPYIVCATRSPNLEFNELKLNCNRFQALIEVMNEKNAVILLRQQNTENNCLNCFFVVMSSHDSNTLVMKEIATKEIVLPNFTDSIDTMVSKTASKAMKDSIRSQLNGFPFADVYNPLFIENNLFNIL